MDVVLRTGFGQITHNINFQPATEPKGMKLFKANHVRNVQEYRHDGVSLFIQADVIRQTSVSSEPYRTHLTLNPDRLVVGVSCTCVYNQSGRCKHIAALIYYVNNYESLSKTNFEQQWGKPTPKQFAKEKYCKGASFAEMFPPTPYLEMALRLPNPDELTCRSSLKIMLAAEIEVCNEQVQEDVDCIVLELVENVEEKLRKEACEVCMFNIHNFVDDHIVHSSKPIVSDSIKLFYDSHIRISSEDIISLCSETIDQAKSSKWQSARSCRFSASATIHKIKVRKTKTVRSLLEELFFPKQCSNVPAIQYGKDNENVARELYETIFNKEVKEVGVVVSKYQPWLCASPDGILVEDGCIVGLIEIKCPSSCENLPIVDFVNRKCNVNYLQYLGNEVILRKSHVYYTQCQVQMYVCGLNVCELFVYSPVENGSCVIVVHRDELFIKEAILKSEEFFFTHFLPILCSKTKEENEKNKSIKSNDQISRTFTGKNIKNTMNNII